MSSARVGRLTAGTPRFCISTLIVQAERSGSNEPYLTGLLGGLSELETDDRYLLLTSPANDHRFAHLDDRFARRSVGLLFGARLSRIIYDQCLASRAAERAGAAVIHFPGTVGSVFARLPSVVTIHYDFSTHLGSISWPKRLYLRTLFGRSLRHASRLIAPSASFRRDLTTAWGVDPHKIVVVWHGVPRVEEPARRAAGDLLARLALRPGFLLAVTSDLPHKNVDVLLDAYARVRRQVSAPTLLIVGGPRETRQTEDLPGVLAIGSLAHETLLALYSHAAVVVLPSGAESFSMAAAEALAAGIPVIASSIGAHREVVDGAGLYVPVGDAAALAQAMHRFLENASLRADLRARAEHRCHLFSWRRAAAATREVYLDAMRTSPT